MKLPAVNHRARQFERNVRRARLPEPPSPGADLRLASTDELLELKAALAAKDEATVARICAVLEERRLRDEPPHPDADAVPVATPRLSLADVEHAQRRAEAPSRFLSDGHGVEIELAFDPAPSAGVPRLDVPRPQWDTSLCPKSPGHALPEVRADEAGEPEPQPDLVIPWDNGIAEPPKVPKSAPVEPASWQGPPDPRSWAAFKRSGDVTAIDITTYVF